MKKLIFMLIAVLIFLQCETEDNTGTEENQKKYHCQIKIKIETFDDTSADINLTYLSQNQYVTEDVTLPFYNIQDVNLTEENNIYHMYFKVNECENKDNVYIKIYFNDVDYSIYYIKLMDKEIPYEFSQNLIVAL